jgi:hypothetical protein
VRCRRRKRRRGSDPETGRPAGQNLPQKNVFKNRCKTARHAKKIQKFKIFHTLLPILEVPSSRPRAQDQGHEVKVKG